jgi:hypothetical protein
VAPFRSSHGHSDQLLAAARAFDRRSLRGARCERGSSSRNCSTNPRHLGRLDIDQVPASRITASRSEDATGRENPVPTVRDDDVEEAYLAAQRLGYEIVHPLNTEPWGIRRFFVRVPGKACSISLSRGEGAQFGVGAAD